MADGGNVELVIAALVAAKNEGVEFDFRTAAATDLAGV